MFTFFITGGAGFIGSNFIEYVLKNVPQALIINLDKLTYAGNLDNLEFAKNYKNYKFFNGSINNTELINFIFNKYVPDVIINFAAESHVDRSIQNPENFIKTNILGTANILNCAKGLWDRVGYNDKLFLQVSTDEVYGSLELDKKDVKFTENSLINPHSPYAASKASADLLVQSYYDTYKFPTLITRCSNNFGPKQYPEKLIPLVITKALNNLSIPVYGDGLNVRDWIFVGEHCKAIYNLVKSRKVGEVFNIGANNEKSNIEIVKQILDIMEKPYSLIEYVEDRLGHDRRYSIDPMKIKNEIGFVAENNFTDKLIYTVNWYLNKFNNN